MNFKSAIVIGLIAFAGVVNASIQTKDFAEAKKLSAEHTKPILIDFMTET